MEFLGSLAAGFQGQQDYDLYQRKRQADMQAMQIRQWEMQKYQQDMAAARQRQSMMPAARSNYIGWEGRPDDGPVTPPPMRPPQVQVQPETPTPQPGQASVPMVQPSRPMAQPQSNPMSDEETPAKRFQRLKNDEAGLKREMMRPGLTPDSKMILQGEFRKNQQALAQFEGHPQQPPLGPMTSGGGMPPGGGMMQTGGQRPQGQPPPQEQPQAAPALAPYRSMDSVGQPSQQGQNLVPTPPNQQPQPSRLRQFIQYLKKQGKGDEEIAFTVEQYGKNFENEDKAELAQVKAMNTMLLGYSRLGQNQPLTEAKIDLTKAQTAALPEKTAATTAQAAAATTRAGAAVTSAEASKARAQAMADRVKQAGSLAGFENEDVAYWAEVMEKGGTLPPRLANTPGGKALTTEVMKSVARSGVTPTAMLSNQAEFGSEKSAQRTLGTRAANMGMAVNEASQFADLALEAAGKVSRTNFVPLNKVVQMVQTNTASPEQAAFVAANVSFVNAYAAAVSRSGGKTVHDTQEAKAMLDTAQGHDAYKAVIAQLKREMAAAAKSPEIVKGDLRRDKGAAPRAPSKDLPPGFKVDE